MVCVCIRVAHTHLVGPHQVQADVRVAGGGVNTVLTEVLAHVLRRGLREKTIETLPRDRGKRKEGRKRIRLRGVCT